MSSKLNCQQIITRIKEIQSKKNEFDRFLQLGEVESSLKAQVDLARLVQEALEDIWPLEFLNYQEIEKQYKSWQEMYDDLKLSQPLPSKERVFEYLKKKPEFLELMRTKEKQGFTQFIIAPAPGQVTLKELTDKIGKKIESAGGDVDFIPTNVWVDAFKEDNCLRYFGELFFPLNVESEVKYGAGKTAKEIEAEPDKYGICDGWMISFTVEQQNIPFWTSTGEQDTGNGRKAIMTGLTAYQYQEKYFLEKNEVYKGEKAMIPQEYLVLFALDLYEKYIKLGKKESSLDLLGSKTSTFFIDVHVLGEDTVPILGLFANHELGFTETEIHNYGREMGVRSVVRSVSKK